MKPSDDIARLIEIMAALRTPVTGCPWDVEQTFETIAPYTIEEAYEVADAIARGDRDDLRDELGDLLLQVVYHARIAEESGDFAFGDVVTAITTKMIRRHPHVFGDVAARNAGMAKDTWNRIKAEEKADKKASRAARSDPNKPERAALLDDVPLAFPALTRALKLQEKAATVGFDWSDAAPVLAKIEEEIGELRTALEAKDGKATAEEFGDVLFSVVNFARHLKIDPEAALSATNHKFRTRFSAIERALAEQGRSTSEASLAEMEELWQQAKADPASDSASRSDLLTKKLEGGALARLRSGAPNSRWYNSRSSDRLAQPALELLP